MQKVKVYNLNADFCAKERENGNYYSFSSLKELEEDGLKVAKCNYDLVWEGEFEDGYTLNNFYEDLQWERPEGFKGHSLSVSDVVEIDGVAKYCDSVGWKVLENWND